MANNIATVEEKPKKKIDDNEKLVDQQISELKCKNKKLNAWRSRESPDNKKRSFRRSSLLTRKRIQGTERVPVTRNIVRNGITSYICYNCFS